MKTAVAIATLFSGILAACTTEATPDSTLAQLPPETLRVDVDGTTRLANIEMPLPMESGPLPLVMVFHGGGGSADRMQSVSQSLSRQLRAHGYIVAYMNGSSRLNLRNLRTWNADHCCAYAQDHHINDAAFIDATVSELSSLTDVDTDRIFLLGHSNGAMLSYRVASDLSFTPAGVVAISGAMFDDQPDIPAATSVLAIHTRDDAVVSFDGSADRSERHRTAPHLPFASVRNRLETLKACTQSAETTPLPGLTISEAHCEGESRVVTFASNEGGHEWPKAIPGFDLEAGILTFLDG